MLHAVIFDLDGLLMDTEIVSYQIYRELLSGFGQEFTQADYAQAYSGKSERKNVAHLIETYSLPWSLEEGLEKVLSAETRLLVQGVSIKSGAKELLDYLSRHGFQIALATSSTEERARNMLRQHHIIGHFHQFVFAHEVEHGKPAPDIFLLACEKLKEAPENCLVLEDSEAGIQAAVAAGIPVICVPDMKRPPQAILDRTAAVLGSLDQVIPYLERVREGQASL